MYTFLWKGRGDPVKRAMVVQPYYHDGLKMVDICLFIKSLKIGWIKRLHHSVQDWTLLANKCIPPTDRLLTYGARKLTVIANKVTNPFWKEVVTSWADFINAYKPSREEILSSSIWFSHLTKFKSSMIRSWYNRGIRFIADLINIDTGELYTCNELRQHYGVSITFLCYQSLKRSLPECIQRAQNQTTVASPIIPYQFSFIRRDVNTNRIAYKEFLTVLRNKNIDALQSWKTRWEQNGVEDPYIGSMLAITSTTKNTYLHSLHFRIISRIITTNRFLYTIRQKESPVCSFCSVEVETLDHLFWTCPKTKNFLQRVQTLLSERIQLRITFQKSKWFIPAPENCSEVEILIITVAKSVIYRARNKNQQPNDRCFFIAYEQRS